MKLKFPISFFIILVPFILFTGCISDGEYDDFYYSPEEVVDAWISGAYDGDFDQMLNCYINEAHGVFNTNDNEPYYSENIEGIGDYLYEYYDDIYDRLDEEYPEIYWSHSEDGSHSEAYIYYEKERMGETFRLIRSGDFYLIESQELGPYNPLPIPSPLFEWADEDENSKIDYQEVHKVVFAVHELLMIPEDVNNDLEDIFDQNRDGWIDEEERQMAKEYFYVAVVSDLLTRDYDFAINNFDLNGDREIEEEEIGTVITHLFMLDMNRLMAYNEDNDLLYYLDKDESGDIDLDEQNSLYWQLLWPLSFYSHPEDPITYMNSWDDGSEGEQTESDNTNSIQERHLSGGNKIRGKRLAVVNIESLTSKIDEETEKGLLLFVENSFVNTGEVTVVDRNSIEKIMEEHKFQAGGITDEQTAVEIGKLAGAEVIVLGSLSSVGSKFYLQIRLIDVQTAEVLASGLSEAPNADGFLDMTRLAVESLF